MASSRATGKREQRGSGQLKAGRTMKLGILKTDEVRPEWVPEFGEYPDMFMALLKQADPELEFAVYDVQRGQYPLDIDEVDAYLITGSKAGVYDDQPWIAKLMAFVRELHSRRKKLIGICFGHQLVAQALGGKVEKSGKGWGVGLHTHHFNTVPAWHGEDDSELDILVSHQDQVLEPPPEAQVLASSDFCEYAVCQVGDHILTFQGHPEFVPGYAQAIMGFRREILGEETYEKGMASMEGTHEGERVARRIINFLRN
jgi:GMP synthase-like glutamine amidotransferase